MNFYSRSERNIGMNKSKTWQLSKQFGRDMHNSPFVEAICEHGVGHHKGVHGCDGCCSTWPLYVSQEVSED